MQRQQIHRLLASFTGAVRIHPHAEPIRKSSPILCSGLARMKTSQCPIVSIPYWKTYPSRRRKSILAGSSASITISTIKVNRKMSSTNNCAICIASSITLTFAVSQTSRGISHRWRSSILLFYEDSTEECSAFWWCSITMWTFSYRGTLTVSFGRGKLTLLING